MTLILILVLLAGIGGGIVLLKLGVRSMPARYALSVLLGYAVFVLGVRLWLWYAHKALPHLEREVIEVEQGARPPSLPPERDSSAGSTVVDLASSGDVLGYGGDGCLAVGVVILVVAAVAGAGVYILAATPELLGEAVAQLALTAALRRKGRVWDGGHWSGSVLRATWVPALMALVGAVILGLLLQAKCPAAVTLFGALSRCP